ncbi:SERTA domain-containing protein 3 [Marasmius crinis-equi]|uniref:SERTA domain-containing protein 3 n=1 Tax=Marasmius crinis-equi TaxID=585013 RepID=A0ABR3FBJ8_9AGAR
MSNTENPSADLLMTMDKPPSSICDKDTPTPLLSPNNPVEQSNSTHHPSEARKPNHGSSATEKEDVDMNNSDDDRNVDEDDPEDTVTLGPEAVAFLESQLLDYLALGSKKSRRGYWATVLPAFLEKFPSQLELEKKVKVKRVEEKSEAELQAMSKKQRRAFKARLKRSKYNPKQRLLLRIKNWFWWRLGRKKGDKKVFQPLFDDMKRGRQAPRRRQLIHIIMDDYPEEVKALSKETSHLNQLQCRAEAAREILKQMEPQVRRALEQKKEDEFEEKMRVYKGQQATLERGDDEGDPEEGEDMSGEAKSSKALPALGWSKMSVEQRAEMLRCREGFIPIVQPFLDGLRDLTGYSMVLLAGVCTDPKVKKFTQATVHSKPENMPDFAEHSGEKFKDFGKLFWRWVRDIKVATDAEPETTSSANKPDGAGPGPNTDSRDQTITQSPSNQPQQSPAAAPEQPTDKTSKKKRQRKSKATKEQGETTEGQRKSGGKKGGREKGKGKVAADIWDSDRADQSSDDEVEGLGPNQEVEGRRTRPQPVRRSNRIQANENSTNQSRGETHSRGETEFHTEEDLPAAPLDLSPLHHPKVYALALRYVYDEIKTIGELETKLQELLGEQYTWSALAPLFHATMNGEDGTDSCAAAVKMLETEQLFLDDVEPLYHPEVYRWIRTLLDSGISSDNLNTSFKELLGERYTPNALAPLLDKVIELQETGGNVQEGIREMESAYLERLHRLVASKVGLNGKPASAAERPESLPTGANNTQGDVTMNDLSACASQSSTLLPPSAPAKARSPSPPIPDKEEPAPPQTSVPPSSPLLDSNQQSLNPETWPPSPCSREPLRSTSIRDMNPGTRRDDLELDSSTWNWQKVVKPGSIPTSESQPPSPQPNHNSDPLDREKTTPPSPPNSSSPPPQHNATTPAKPAEHGADVPEVPVLVLTSEYKAFAEIISTIKVDELPSFAKFTAEGVADRFIRGHMALLLQHGGEEMPGYWERVVYKWVDVESIWASREFPDQEVSKEGRPDSLGRWFAYGRLRSTKTPSNVTDNRMEAEWWPWWTNANPDWRVKVDGKVVPGGLGSWDQLRAPGPDGVVLFLITLRWWHDVLQNAEELQKWELAVKGIFEALCCLHQDALVGWNSAQNKPGSSKKGSTAGDGESRDDTLDKCTCLLVFSTAEADSRSDSVPIRQSVVKTEFEKLTAKEQENWKNLAKEEHAQRKREYQQLLEAGYSEDPAKRQAAIDRFPVWIMEVLQEASKATGLHMLLFAGGPIPSAGGELKIIGVHVGRTMGATGQSFGVTYQGAVDLLVSQIYGEFLGDCFSQEDCEAMALEEVSGGDFRGLYEGNEAILFNDVVVPGERSNDWKGRMKLPTPDASSSSSSSSSAPAGAAASLSSAPPAQTLTSAPGHVPAPPANSKPAPPTSKPMISADRSHLKHPSSSSSTKSKSTATPAHTAPVNSKALGTSSSSTLERTSTKSTPALTRSTLAPPAVAASESKSISSTTAFAATTHGKHPRMPERKLPTAHYASSLSSAAPKVPKSGGSVGGEEDDGEQGKWKSTINTKALRRPRTYLAMSTGGQAPLTIAQREEREARRVQALREGKTSPMREMTRKEILERQERSPGWETNGSLGRSVAPCPRRAAPTAKR